MTSRAPIVIPQPSPTYDPARQRQIHGRIQELIGDRLERNEIPQYGGIPYTAVRGINNAFNVPGTGVFTVLPFDQELYNTDYNMVFNPLTFSKTTLHRSSYLSFLQFVHIPSGGGSITIQFGYAINGLVINYQEVVLTASLNVTVESNVIGLLLPNDAVTIQVATTEASGIDLDMTKSRWWTLRLDPDPRMLGDRV